MPIQVDCPACSSWFNAPDATAGRRAKCPKCGSPIDIPAPVGAEVLEAELGPIRPFADELMAAEPLDAPPVQDDRKQCPMCGEMIQCSAIKCRHCGEVFDPTLKGVLGTAGDAREPGWRRVRSGLATLYGSIIVIIITAILAGIGALAVGPGILLLALPVLLGAAIGIIVGQVMCANVPASSGARGYAIGAVCCMLINIVLNGVARATGNEAADALSSLINLAGYVLFILFIRRSATYLNNQSLAASAGKFLIFSGGLFAILFVLGILSGLIGAQAMWGILVVGGLVAALIALAWYLRLIKSLMITIDERSGDK